MDIKELEKLFNNTKCNPNFKKVMLAIETARPDFVKARQLPFYNGILARLGEVYPNDTQILSKVLRDNPSSVLPPRRKKATSNIKYESPDVSPDGGYDENDCPLCGKDGYDSKGNKITGNEIYDDTDDNQLAKDVEEKEKESKALSLSNAETLEDVMNYFGGDTERAKEQMKELLKANEVKFHHNSGYEKLVQAVLLFVENSKK